MNGPVNERLTAFCRSCLAPIRRRTNHCEFCGGGAIRHDELHELSIAHVDCDAFYAAIEKRDDPSLENRAVIVGGGVRGVVSTACYVARTYGVKSAMPMFKALKLCPDAVVIKPNMRKYAEAARQIRNMMEELTPLVEPLSIDEAFLDLQGTARLHGLAPAQSLARLQNVVRRDIGVTVSVGLSYNKFMAKIASDLDKPSGFSVLGRRDGPDFLARQPTRIIWGVGAAFAERLQRDGYQTVGDLASADPAVLARKYGETGLRLARLSRGEDSRSVRPVRETKSVSGETTFNEDIRDVARLEDVLWSLCERTSTRMKYQGLVGRTVTLKLKSADFRLTTRRATLDRPSNLARVAFRACLSLLKETARGEAFRLIGIGFSDLSEAKDAPQTDLFGAPERRLAAQEAAIDEIRERFGTDAVKTGRGLRGEED
jgi:DNA polymerase-4